MADKILERVSQDEHEWFINESKLKELMDRLTLENYVKESEAEHKTVYRHKGGNLYVICAI